MASSSSHCHIPCDRQVSAQARPEGLGTFSQTAESKSHPKPTKLNIGRAKTFSSSPSDSGVPPALRAIHTLQTVPPSAAKAAAFLQRGLKSQIKTPKRKIKDSFGMCSRSREMADPGESFRNS